MPRKQPRASHPALDGIPIQPPRAFWQVVQRMRDSSLAPPGRERPGREHPIQTTAFSQHKKHAAWCPPGFAALRAIVDDKVAFFEKAKEVQHPLTEVHVTLPLDLRLAIDKVCEKRQDILEWRERRMRGFERDAELLREYSHQLNMLAPPHVREAAGSAHVALYLAAIVAFDWPHASFARDHCLRGFAIMGDVKDTGLFRLKTPAEAAKKQFIPPLELLQTNVAWTAQLIAITAARWRAARSDATEREKLREAWDQSTAQVGRGLAEGPLTIDTIDTRYGRGKWRPVGVHLVWQKTKWRLCDNMRGNKTNRAYRSPEANVVPRPDAPAAIGRHFYDHARAAGWTSQCDLAAGTEDEADAYQHSATRAPQHTVRLVADPATGSVRGFRPFGHNFGLEAAVLNYNSKPELEVAIARRLFAAVIEHFFDDFVAGPEPSFARGANIVGQSDGSRAPQSSQGMLWRMKVALGTALARPKSVFYATAFTWIGVETDFSRLLASAEIRLRCKPSTVQRARGIVRKVIEAGSLTPAQASSLRGKLLWVWLYGKLGRVEIAALADRQYARDRPEEGGDTLWALTEALSGALGFVQGMLGGSLPDVVLRAASAEDKPAVILSDAMWEPAAERPHGRGHMGYIIWIPLRTGGGKLAFAEAPASERLLAMLQRLKEQKTFVCPLEAVGMLAPYVCSTPGVRESIAGLDVVHFGDNQGANGAAVKGFSGAKDIAHIVRALRWAWHSLDIDPWVEYVRSDANLADDPSRSYVLHLLAMGAVRVNFDVPESLYEDLGL